LDIFNFIGKLWYDQVSEQGQEGGKVEHERGGEQGCLDQRKD
jgi:hypothetical protein